MQRQKFKAGKTPTKKDKDLLTEAIKANAARLQRGQIKLDMFRKLVEREYWSDSDIESVRVYLNKYEQKQLRDSVTKGTKILYRGLTEK